MRLPQRQMRLLKQGGLPLSKGRLPVAHARFLDQPVALCIEKWVILPIPLLPSAT